MRGIATSIMRRAIVVAGLAASTMLAGCGSFHSYHGDVGYRDVIVHFRSDEQIDQLWKKCGGTPGVQAFAIRHDDGSCEVWMSPPKNEEDPHFTKVLYHELGHCEDASFETTHTVQGDCASED